MRETLKQKQQKTKLTMTVTRIDIDNKLFVELIPLKTLYE